MPEGAGLPVPDHRDNFWIVREARVVAAAVTVHGWHPVQESAVFAFICGTGDTCTIGETIIPASLPDSLDCPWASGMPAESSPWDLTGDPMSPCFSTFVITGIGSTCSVS